MKFLRLSAVFSTAAAAWLSLLAAAWLLRLINPPGGSMKILSVVVPCLLWWSAALSWRRYFTAVNAREDVEK